MNRENRLYFTESTVALLDLTLQSPVWRSWQITYLASVCWRRIVVCAARTCPYLQFTAEIEH